jgi:HIV Tat-specific factor 1
LADWDDDDPAALPAQNPKWAKLVYLKHMFTLKELDEDPAARIDIADDIRDECSKLGDVSKVVLFDQEQDGIASVRFTTPDAALACVKVMDGRHFDGRQVVAFIADGSERFKKTSEHKNDDEEEQKRLDEFGNWLEQQEGDATIASERA